MRRRRRSPSPGTLLALVVAGLLATGLGPTRFTKWVTWFNGPLMAVIAPASWPASAVANWVRPSRLLDAPALTDREAQRQLAEWKTMYRREQQRVAELERHIRALQGGVSFDPQTPVRRLTATRVGADLRAGTISVNRGARQGVTLNTVATATEAPHHLVGIVTQAGPSTCVVHVATDQRLTPNLIEATILPADGGPEVRLEEAPRCQLRPTASGELEASVREADAERISAGEVAHVNDPTWPPGAQMLVIGRVWRIEPTDVPLHKRLVVRPEFDLSRVRSVVLRIAVETESGPAGEGGEGAGP